MLLLDVAIVVGIVWLTYVLFNFVCTPPPLQHSFLAFPQCCCDEVGSFFRPLQFLRSLPHFTLSCMHLCMHVCLMMMMMMMMDVQVFSASTLLPDIPGPRPKPLFGNVLEMMADPLVTFQAYRKQYGKLGPCCCICICFCI